MSEVDTDDKDDIEFVEFVEDAPICEFEYDSFVPMQIRLLNQPDFSEWGVVNDARIPDDVEELTLKETIALLKNANDKISGPELCRKVFLVMLGINPDDNTQDKELWPSFNITSTQDMDNPLSVDIEISVNSDISQEATIRFSMSDVLNQSIERFPENVCDDESRQNWTQWRDAIVKALREVAEHFEKMPVPNDCDDTLQ